MCLKMYMKDKIQNARENDTKFAAFFASAENTRVFKHGMNRLRLRRSFSYVNQRTYMKSIIALSAFKYILYDVQ